MFATEQKIQVLDSVPEKISILVVSPHHDDHNVVRRLLQHGNWDLSRAGSVEEALTYLAGKTPAVVVCERDLPDGGWRDILRHAGTLQSSPAVVVISRQADESLWGEVLNEGGYDVLPKPFDRGEVIRVLGMAWRHAWSFRKRPMMAAVAY